MSQRTFARRFLASTGTTPLAWLTRERLRFARRLLETGVALPVPAMGSGPGPDQVTVVIPVRDRAAELALCLQGLRDYQVLVVDDGSEDPATVAAVARAGEFLGEVARRVSEFAGLAEEVMAQRAADRIGESVEVLVEETVLAADGGGEGRYEGRAAHQAPDVDGSTTLLASRPLRAGDLVSAQVVDSVGADLIARA